MYATAMSMRWDYPRRRITAVPAPERIVVSHCHATLLRRRPAQEGDHAVSARLALQSRQVPSLGQNVQRIAIAADDIFGLGYSFFKIRIIGDGIGKVEAEHGNANIVPGFRFKGLRFVLQTCNEFLKLDPFQGFRVSPVILSSVVGQQPGNRPCSLHAANTSPLVALEVLPQVASMSSGLQSLPQ